MCRKIKNKKQIKQETTAFDKFCKLWVETNKAYRDCFDNNKHLQFPEPALKKLIGEKYKLTSTKPSPYDFDDNIELKSVTLKNGNIPFQFSENECKQIYYCEILNGIINVYHLGKDQVTQINKKINEEKIKCEKENINRSFLNINMKEYKGDIIDARYDLNEGDRKAK